MSKGSYHPIVLKDLENDIPIFAGEDVEKGTLTLILGNIKEAEIESYKESFEASLAKEFRGEIAVTATRNQMYPSRFDLEAQLGPYKPRHKFDAARRALDRYMDVVLDAGPNLKDEMDAMFKTSH